LKEYNFAFFAEKLVGFGSAACSALAPQEKNKNKNKYYEYLLFSKNDIVYVKIMLKTC
jgi:hypothetical protein